jgi:hypothetical protein
MRNLGRYFPRTWLLDLHTTQLPTAVSPSPSISHEAGSGTTDDETWASSTTSLAYPGGLYATVKVTFPSWMVLSLKLPLRPVEVRIVDLISIGAYVRRWQRWARSGLRVLEEELSNRALELVCRSLGRVGRSHWLLPPLIPAVAGPAVGKASAYRDSRHPQR